MEGWLSGRRHTTRNRAGMKVPREFKSLPLRKYKINIPLWYAYFMSLWMRDLKGIWKRQTALRFSKPRL